MHEFLAGLVTAGYLVAALFFLRFWRRTRDGLFASFAGAFALMAVMQTLTTLVEFGREEGGWVYLIRLAAFLLILAAFARKNLKFAGR
jgi:hypothetical protein